MNKEIGNRIKRIRISKQIDAKKVAVEIGIRDTSYSKIEREGTNSLITLQKIASVLSVKISDLLEDKPATEPKTAAPCLSREEWIQAHKELLHLIRNEFKTLSEKLIEPPARSKKGKSSNNL